MRFRKGSKVEVLSTKDVPSGSWHRAEIIHGDGHICTVRYCGTEVLDRVSGKAVRPCPPLPKVAENWVLGDVVEVFDDFSWKMAKISKILSKSQFLVRLLGSIIEFKVSNFEIRSRQSWEDNKWVLIGKGSGSYEDGKNYENLTLKLNQSLRNHAKGGNGRTNVRVKDGCFMATNKEKLQESNNASYKTMKRGSYGFSQFDICDTAQKFRAVEKEGRLYRLVAAHQSPLCDPVESAALPWEMLGEKFMHSSLNSQTGFYEIDAERRRSNAATGCTRAVGIESNGADSVTCSVGSCSINGNNAYELNHHAGLIEDMNGHCSDAESICQWGYDEGNLAKEELATEIHRLELHAYRCTMGALHASGALSWEQEVLVTNLRLSLHISNDEHLMEG